MKRRSRAGDSTFKQIATRRILDFAEEGIRMESLPYIGILNNSRTRAALRTTLDSFLSRMIADGRLIDYTLSITATREEEIQGISIVEATLKPASSIYYIKVIMTLS